MYVLSSVYLSSTKPLSLDLLPDPCLQPGAGYWSLCSTCPRSAPAACPARPTVHSSSLQLLDRHNSPGQALLTVYMCTINASYVECNCPLPQHAGHWHPSPACHNSQCKMATFIHPKHTRTSTTKHSTGLANNWATKPLHEPQAKKSCC